MAASAAPSSRRRRAVESFRTAADCIGPLEPGASLFAITRGQWSMIDAILYCLSQTGPAAVSLWTWTIAEYEVDRCAEQLAKGGITSGLLVLDAGEHDRVRKGHGNQFVVARWRELFGPESVKDCATHAKIATVEGGGLRLLLRGSMNLNYNPRFEQFDLTEGGPDFDLIRRVESEIPVLPVGASKPDRRAASRANDAFDPSVLKMFDAAPDIGPLKVWRP